MFTIELESLVDELLNNFYRRRIEKINTLKLKEALSRKNPYLYKATGMENANDIIKEILSAYMSSSDEGIFGDAFFEVLAEEVSNGIVSDSEGVDVRRTKGNVYQAIAVKSGTNVFNASSRKKQIENFRSLQKRVAKRGMVFQPIIGYGYGKKTTSDTSEVTELAGQLFWEELTGDPNFYIEIINLIGDKPQKHLQDYQNAFSAAVNRFTRDFTIEFCNEDGSIDWEKLVEFNSGKPCIKLETNFKKNKALKLDEEFQLEVIATFSDNSSEDLISNAKMEYIIEEPFKDVLNITSDGLVKFTSETQYSRQIKVVISAYNKSVTRSFSLKKGKIES
ncbi:PmeII family type II restriction endonuclease [Lysinibacillus sp. NPDC086135]|uniref:PmeII family type II restriction endonuclease n=1 Tax=Lysinibacillus sp. NPDC086135 TaxID=3364130 RepID=UPI00381EAB63